MYDNYIFDLYGTLVDIRTNEENPYLWKKMTEIYASYGAYYDKGELRKVFRNRCQELEKTAVNQWFEPNVTAVFWWCFSQKGISVSLEIARNIAIMFRVFSRKYIRLYDGVEELLGALKSCGKNIYLLSNAQSDFTRPEITLLGLEKYFDGIFISSEVGVKKPGVEFYEKLVKTYDIALAKSIMIGNDIKADILGAKAVGLHTLYINSNISPMEDIEQKNVDFGATYTIWDGDFHKIAPLICKNNSITAKFMNATLTHIR